MAGKIEKAQIIIRMPAALKEQLGKEACELGISFNAYVLSLIRKARHYQ